jgi:translation elongation factor P/translation initiation factor 5A
LAEKNRKNRFTTQDEVEEINVERKSRDAKYKAETQETSMMNLR